ncbi:MAG: hypothetical protein IPL94_13305 [Tetrasphaera sp.]|nr:hypothetical protein [Tetrasphaera sp.]
MRLLDEDEPLLTHADASLLGEWALKIELMSHLAHDRGTQPPSWDSRYAPKASKGLRRLLQGRGISTTALVRIARVGSNPSEQEAAERFTRLHRDLASFESRPSLAFVRHLYIGQLFLQVFFPHTPDFDEGDSASFISEVRSSDFLLDLYPAHLQSKRLPSLSHLETIMVQALCGGRGIRMGRPGDPSYFLIEEIRRAFNVMMVSTQNTNLDTPTIEQLVKKVQTAYDLVLAHHPSPGEGNVDPKTT